MEKTEDREIEEKMVLCRKLNNAAYVRLADCLKCEFHKELCETVPAQNDKPAVIDILCNLPVRVRVSYLIGSVT